MRKIKTTHRKRNVLSWMMRIILVIMLNHLTLHHVRTTFKIIIFLRLTTDECHIIQKVIPFKMTSESRNRQHEAWVFVVPMVYNYKI